MDNQIIFSLHRVGKKYPPAKQVLNNISISFFYGAKIGVLGYNGSGKSTLLRIIAGIETEFDGNREMSKGYTIGMLEQEPLVGETRTVKEIVRDGLGEMAALVTEYETVCDKLGQDLSPEEMDKLINRQSVLQEKIDAADAWNLDSHLEMAMESLRCPPGDQLIATVSGGERRRVALCRLLLSKPDILLLDEPTNHLDAESVYWLEQHLAKYEGTVIAVTHDRYFLDNVAGWILELDRGEGIPFKGNYSSWLEQKEERLRHEAKAEAKRQKTLARELEWIRMSPKARHAKGKARVNAYNDLFNQNNKEALQELELFLPPGPRLGNIVVKCDKVAKAFGETLLYDSLTFSLPPAGIVGVIGPNGAGKTTLFKLITGSEKPDSGKLEVGSTVKIGYVDQSRHELDNSRTVWEEITGGQEEITLGPITMNSRAYVSRFNFSGTDQQKKVGTLSGGERNRVHLAKMLKIESNLLLLDEPTNDFDVNAVRALEDGLANFAGCAVIISHDRWFLDRVCTHILACESDSTWIWIEGNWSDYEADRRKRLGDTAAVPTRIKYRKLTR